MRSPWEPLVLGVVLWLVGGVAALFIGMYDTTAGVLVASGFGAVGAIPVQVGVIALGVRLGNESQRQG